MKYIAIIFLAVLSCSAATIGLEDLSGPTSDYDQNDVQLLTTGLSFHTLEPWTFVAPPGYAETPFPEPAHYFDYAVAGRQVGVWIIGGETTAVITPLISINGGDWMPISGFLGLSTTAGDLIRFGVLNDGTVLSSDPSQNLDGKSYSVVADEISLSASRGRQDAPEPASVLLIGGGLAVMGLWRRRRA